MRHVLRGKLAPFAVGESRVVVETHAGPQVEGVNHAGAVHLPILGQSRPHLQVFGVDAYQTFVDLGCHSLFSYRGHLRRKDVAQRFHLVEIEDAAVAFPGGGGLFRRTGACEKEQRKGKNEGAFREHGAPKTIR
ncbi:MAG: hypothetical protein LKM36_02225 [Flavobacteriales bacterium]|nr:hypothetical protein [Flavobacteriales bacterium]